jgi:hypothetical protein
MRRLLIIALENVSLRLGTLALRLVYTTPAACDQKPGPKRLEQQQNRRRRPSAAEREARSLEEAEVSKLGASAKRE